MGVTLHRVLNEVPGPTPTVTAHALNGDRAQLVHHDAGHDFAYIVCCELSSYAKQSHCHSDRLCLETLSPNSEMACAKPKCNSKGLFTSLLALLQSCSSRWWCGGVGAWRRCLPAWCIALSSGSLLHCPYKYITVTRQDWKLYKKYILWVCHIRWSKFQNFPFDICYEVTTL